MLAEAAAFAIRAPAPALGAQHVWVDESNPSVFPPQPALPQQVPFEPDYMLSVRIFPAQHVLVAFA